MSSGNGWIQHLWNGDIINIRYRVKEPKNYQFEKNKEGGFPVGSDTIAIPANAEHPGTALLFIDHMLNAKTAAKNVTWTGYPMPNKGQDQTVRRPRQGRPRASSSPSTTSKAATSSRTSAQPERETVDQHVARGEGWLIRD